MGADDRNRNEDEALAELLARVGPRAVPPIGVRARIEAAVLERLAEQRLAQRRRRAWGWSGVALAASLLLAVVATQLAPRPAVPPTLVVAFAEGASLVRADGSMRPLPMGAAVPVGATLEAGQGLVLGIGDGGSLRLAAASTLRYLPDGAFELTAGAAYYDSLGPSGRRGRAIELRTRFGAVRDIGTQFEAKVSEVSLRLRVREGRVAVDGVSETVSAGTQLTLNAEGASYAQIALSGADWAWAERLAPPLAIDGASADAYLRWVAREGGYTLRYASPSAELAARATQLRGTLPLLAPVATLDAILPATDLVHAIDGTDLRISDAQP